MNRKHFLTAFALLAFALPGQAQSEAAAQPASEPAVAAVAKSLPAVVNINTERIVRRAVRDPYDDFISQYFGGQVAPRREIRQKVQSLGSGFIVDPAGYIVTNEHVVERAEDLKIQVTTADGKTYNARYVTGDSSVDLALLKIESKTPLPYISLQDPSPNLLGETVLVLGNPVGYGHSVARGILSATNRALTVENTSYDGLLQTDAAINPGNSGGPLVDLSGKLVGIASAKMAYAEKGVPIQGIGFAIPAKKVAERVEQFKQEAKNPGPSGRGNLADTARRRLGLSLQEMTADLSDVMGLPDPSGVLISDVEPQSPAARAGMRRGLVLYKVGRYEVNNPAEVHALLARAGRGTPVDLTLGILRQVGSETIREIQTVSINAR